MDAAAQLRSQKYLYLASIGEPRDNRLRLILDAAESFAAAPIVADGPFTAVSPIAPGPSTPSFEVLFNSYVAYAVRNESFVEFDRAETWTGGLLFREYSSSQFLDFVRSSTFASDAFPGSYTHFGFCCLNHIVDVASIAHPQITVLAKPLGV